MTQAREHAATPDDLTRLFVERTNARDADGMAELYAPDAVMAYPPGSNTVGRAAIRAVCARMLEHMPAKISLEQSIPTVSSGDIALTSTRSADNVGIRVQVARRQPDGTWLRIIDRPEVRPV